MTDGDLWASLFSLGPVMRQKPAANLYDLLASGDEDLELIKAYVAAGHDPDHQFAGGHTAKLAVSHGRLETVQFFVNHCENPDGPDLCHAAVNRIAESTGTDLEEARSVLDFLLARFTDQPSLRAAYSCCAAFGQLSTADAVLDIGLEDAEIQCGPDEFQKYSDWLVERDYAPFASLLKGDDVERKQLERNELKQQRRGAKARALKRELIPFASIAQLSGSEFAAAHQSTLDAVVRGDRDAELLSHDPHRHRSVLEFLAENDFTGLLSAVLARGVFDKQRLSHDGYAAATAAATHGHLESIERLAGAGVTVAETPDNSHSPLSEAVRFGHFEVVEWLLANGADPKSSDGSGHSPKLTELAGGLERTAIVKLLQA